MKTLKEIGGESLLTKDEPGEAIANHVILNEVGARGDGVALFRPSAFYFRNYLRGARSLAEAVKIGMIAVAELEATKEWIRGQGWDVGPSHILRGELTAKTRADTLALRRRRN